MLTGVEDRDSRQGAPSPDPLLPAQPSPLLTNLSGLLSVLPPKLSKWVKVGVESFETRPFTPFPSVNSRMTTDSVIQSWSRNMVQTSFG